MAEESPLSIALELIRKDGLIVLALAALMWQVWFVSNEATQDRAATRTQLNDFIALSRESLEQRKQTALEFTTTFGSLSEAVRRTESACTEKKK